MKRAIAAVNIEIGVYVDVDFNKILKLERKIRIPKPNDSQNTVTWARSESPDTLKRNNGHDYGWKLKWI